jgi:hydrogenase maturation factor HypF (carbamoyltransferase family)
MKPVLPEPIRLSRERDEKRRKLAGLRPGWLCPKCGSTHADHCHTEGHFRGILCTRCNPMLGYAQHSPNILRRAAAYLEETNYDWHSTRLHR